MVKVTGDWSADRMAAFLADATIPIRLSCLTPGENLWMLSLWYLHRDGAFHCATAASADVVGYLEHDERVAFEVSTNDVPYRGVRGRGTASVGPDPGKTLLTELVDRYLGSADSDLAQWLLSEERSEVHITIEPDRLYTWDYADRM